MMSFLIYFIYRPLFSLIKALLPVFHKKLDAKLLSWIQLRETPVDINLSGNSNVFWFHASSGEIEYAKALIRELKIADANATVVVTYSSPSAIRLFENIKDYVHTFIPLPWDQPKPVAELIRQINPKAVVFARTDFWPELIFQLNKKNVPCFAASMNPTFSAWNSFFISTFFKHFKGIFCVHPAQASVLNSMLPKSVYIAAPGDTRFDQVFWRLAGPAKTSISFDFNYGVLGSTWPEDEQVIFPAFKNIIDQGYKLFWCPHETNKENIERLEVNLLGLKTKYIKFSQILAGESFNDVDVILVDKVGYLADLYRTAAWAFVGGSFKAKVHSVMEPLCCAIPVITGPHIQNSPEALRYNQVIMNDLRIVQVIQSTDQFLAAVHAIRNLQLKDFKKMLIGHLEQNRYASVKIIRSILELLN